MVLYNKAKIFKKNYKKHTRYFNGVYLCSLLFTTMNISVKLFKIISILEGLSFIILLGIAMPLKYIWGNPEMVRIVGMAHGILFIAYLYGAYFISKKLQWSTQTLLIVLLCSILPFGPFYADKKYL